MGNNQIIAQPMHKYFRETGDVIALGAVPNQMNVVVLPEITPRNGVVHMKAPFTCVNMQIAFLKYYSLSIFQLF